MKLQFAKRLRRTSLLPLFVLTAFAQTSRAQVTLTQIGGTWVFTSQLPVGSETITDIAKVQLEEDGGSVTGEYFGVLGYDRLLKGTHEGNQVSLTLAGVWPQDGSALVVTLSGTLSATSGSGKVMAGPAQGSFTASRPDPNQDLEPSATVSVDYRSEKPGATHKISPADLPKAGPALTLAGAPKLIPRPPDAWPQAPAGFKVSLYADGFDYPRKLETAPNGDIFLVESHLGQIKILRGLTPGGKAQTVSTFATGLSQPFGIAFYPSGSDPKYVYVGNTGSVVRFPYVNGDLTARGAPETVIPDIPAGGMLVGGGHWTRDLAFSKDGGSLFVSVGSWSEDDDTDNNPKEVHRADVLEYTPDGQFVRIYASGIRNPVGIAVDPNSGRIWASVNERDMEGNDLVPDYITHLEQGGFYGWPWFYIGGNWDPSHQGKHPELRDMVLVPDVLLQAHSASLSMLFYQSAQFPEQYHGDIFAAEHGSWNRWLRTGYEVVRVHLNGGTASGEYEDFLTGFVTKDGQVWGRPVGVTIAADGSLLVSDDASKSVWRVSYQANGKE